MNGDEEKESFRAKVRDADRSIDSAFSRGLDVFGRRTKPEKLESYAVRARSRITEASVTAIDAAKSIEDAGEEYATTLTTRRFVERFLDIITKKPFAVVVILLLISGLIGSQYYLVVQNTQADFEIYLPPDDMSSKVLNEVRNDFSVDIVMILVDATRGNVTSKAVLDEMSYIESRLNRDMGDAGKNDSVVYIMSISSIIKTINNTPPMFAEAVKGEFGRIPLGGPSSLPGDYAIPDQETIDRIVANIPENQMKQLVIDKDGDGTYDHALILVGLVKGAPMDPLIQQMSSLFGGTNNTKMSQTGPAVVLHVTQKRTTAEFLRAIPISLVFVSLVLFFFHRTFKVVVIAGVPILCTLGITFGTVGMLHDFFVISPQIILTGSLLAPLGVAYASYITNKYMEIRHGDVAEKVRLAIKAIHMAIFLSAATTVIGFVSLMVGSIPPVISLGFALALGITVCYILTMFMVPALIVLLDYRKKYNMATWSKIASIPHTHKKKILAVSAVFIIISLYMIPMIKTNADYYLIAPQDEDSVLKLKEASTDFGRGQSGMIIVRGNPRDIKVLDFVNETQYRLGEGGGLTILTIVDIMKMTKIPSSLSVAGTSLPLLVNMSFWDAIHMSFLNVIYDPVSKKSGQQMLIDIFYNTLNNETRAVFVNEKFSKTLILVDMPTMDVGSTRTAVAEINLVLANYGNVPGGTITQLAGIAATSVAVNDLLIASQLQTMALSVVLCCAVIVVSYRSLKLGIVTIIPVCIVIALEPMFQVLMGIELSVITVILASITVGNGVDFSIQITQRIKLGGESLESVKGAVEYGGISFVESTTTVVIGLVGLLLVPIASIRQFIILMGILYVFSAIAALFILPAIYALMFAARDRRELKRKS